MKKIILIAVLSISFSIAMSAQSVLSFDKYHSRLSFSANHLGISFVEGIFKIFDATLISTKEDFSDAQIQMNADVKSISTEVDMRDADLRDNWFELRNIRK